MSTLNPGWIRFLKDMVGVAVDAGGDGYYLDDMVPDYFWGAGYDVWSVVAFRQYLGATFTRQQLVQMGIENVSSFVPSDYFRSRGYLTDNCSWDADPVWREFVKFQFTSYLNNLREIRDTVKGLNSSLSFHGNAGNFPWPWIPMLSSIEDIVQVENWYGRDEFECNYSLPNRMLSWLKIYYSSTLGSKPVWVFGDPGLAVESAQLYKFLIAEGYASGVIYETLYTLAVGLPSGASVQFLSDPQQRTKLEAVSNYTGFIQNHRDLFTHVAPSSRVAFVYSVPTILWNYAPLLADGWRFRGILTSLQGFALALENAHVPYDVLSFGHPDFMNDSYTLSKLGLYDTVVLPSVECVSAAQLDALRDFVLSGGRLVLVGPTPCFDENRIPLREDDVAWLKGQGTRSFGNGTIVNLSDSPDENEALQYWLAQIAGQGNGSSDFSALIDSINTGHDRDIETNAPSSVAITSFTGGSGIILHLLNYGYSNGSVRNISLSVKLPDGFSLGGITLASPDLEADTELQYSLEDGRVTFSVPELEIWDVIVMSPKIPEYKVNVSSEKGATSGAGSFTAGENDTVSVSPTTIEKDFFTNYVFEGWMVNGTIVSYSPSYSFIVTGPVSLTASWKTEWNAITLGGIGCGVVLVLVAAFVLLRRKGSRTKTATGSSPSSR